MRLRTCALTVLPVVLILAACGGDPEADVPPPPVTQDAGRTPDTDAGVTPPPPKPSDAGAPPVEDARAPDASDAGIDAATPPVYQNVGVTVTGLVGGGLVLHNGSDDLPVAANGAFTFATKVVRGGSYAVTVLTQPSSPNQTCVASGGQGTVGTTDVDVAVACTTDRFTVGGTVTGMVGAGPLVLANGADSVSRTTNGDFVFPTTVASGDAYAVTITGQPTGNVCSIAGESGTVTKANVSSVMVSCTSYAATVLASNPVGYWKLDDAAGPAVDQIAGRNGTATNVTFSQPGLVAPATAAGFAGNGKIDVPFDAALNSTEDWSVEAWVNVAASTGDYQSVVTSRDDLPQRGYILYMDPTNRPMFWSGNGSGWYAVVGTAVPLGTRHHLVGTFASLGNGSGKKTFYVDGVSVGSQTVTFVPNTARPFRIGSGATEGSGVYWLNGTIDEVAAYARELPAAEVLAHYTIGTTQQ